MSHICEAHNIMNFHLKHAKERPAGNVQHNFGLGCWGNIRPTTKSPLTEESKNLLVSTQKIFERVVVEALQAAPTAFTYSEITSSIEFFFNGYPKPEDSSPLTRITWTVVNLSAKTVGQKPQEELIKKILDVAFAQHICDPEQFVSHRFSHPLNVIEICSLIWKEEDFWRCFIEKYPFLTSERIKALIELVMYMHDCGYPYLNGKCKATHAFYSSLKFLEFKELLKQILNIGQDNFELLFTDIRRAIFIHNADGGKASFDRRQETNVGTISFNAEHALLMRAHFELADQGIGVKKRLVGDESMESSTGRKLDVLYENDGLMGVKTEVVSFEKEPFAAILRAADNGDFTKYRFSVFQSKQEFQDLYWLKGKLKRPRQPQSVPNESVLLARHPHLQRVAALLNEKSVRHFGGCEPFTRFVSFTKHPFGLKIIVEVDLPLFKALREAYFPADKDEGEGDIATYQLVRAYQAFSRIKLKEDDRDHLGRGLTFEAKQKVELYKGGEPYVRVTQS